MQVHQIAPDHQLLALSLSGFGIKRQWVVSLGSERSRQADTTVRVDGEMEKAFPRTDDKSAILQIGGSRCHACSNVLSSAPSRIHSLEVPGALDTHGSLLIDVRHLLALFLCR